MQRTSTLLLMAVLFSTAVFAQNIGVNGTGAAPDASAMLDVAATDKGMLVPRMTSGQRTTIAAPATGLLVFDNTTTTFWFYDGTAWVELVAGGADSDWITSGVNIYNGNTGNVGVGTTNPQEKLHVVGRERVSTLASGTSGIVTADNLGTLGKTNFTGNTDHALLGNGTFTMVDKVDKNHVETKSIWMLSTDYIVNTTWVQIFSFGTNGSIRISNPGPSTIKYAYATNNGVPVAGNLASGASVDMTGIQCMNFVDIRVARYSITTDDLTLHFLGMGMCNGHLRGKVIWDNF